MHIENNKKRGRPRTFQRKQVVEKAMINYWKEGPQSLSINEICRRLDVSKPAIYREFGGEDGLMMSVLEYYETFMMQQLLMLNKEGDSFSEVLSNLLCFMTQDRETPTGCLVVKMRLSADQLGVQSRVKLLEIRSNSRQFYTLMVKKAIQRREIKTSLSIDLIAHFLENQFAMVMIQMSAGENVEIIREQTRLALSGLLGKANS